MIIGIDPGLSGAVALYSPARSMQIMDIPTFEITVNGHKRRQVDLHQCYAMLVKLTNVADLIVIEEPHAMPKQGVTSAFSFGHVCGMLQAFVVTTGVPMVLVRPNIWKHFCKVPADKDATRKRASQMFPSFAHNWPLKKHDGRAEAALIAWYGACLARPTEVARG
jgi:crossover junction endodeoxyribonuclease RuvC